MSDLKPNRGTWKQWLRNWISLSGLILAASSLFAFTLLFAMELFGAHGNPYMGILAFVVAPGFFVMGSFLILLGMWMQRRQRVGAMPLTLTIDLSRSRDKRLMIGFVLGTVAFLLLTAVGSHRTYTYTESNQFCGLACHGPMKPEYTTYLHSPHARVACVACHVGPGADWYIKAKLNGVHQLIATVTDDYSRPIPTPIANLRPAQQTCEQCHWPEKFVGNLDRTYHHYLADETNTAFSVRLLLKVGGGETPRGPGGGIHWHMNLANKVEYIATDEQRQIVPWVRVTTRDGEVTEYRTRGFTNDPADHTIRTMDCIDCHNRPAHHLLSPNEAVDAALFAGRIDPGIPWVKSNVVEVLTQSYATESAAVQSIREQLRARYPGHPAVDSLVSESQQIFRNNFFPEMKANWSSYPDNSGHKEWRGCFRCHDGSHKTADGRKTLGASDCNSCHIILGQGSGPDLEQLNARGHDFLHIDAVHMGFDCYDCHTGAFPK